MFSHTFINFINERTEIEISEVLEASNNSSDRLTINLNGINNMKLMLTQKQAEELCEKLEEALYDEPTYSELDRQCILLMNEKDELVEELEQYRELEEERSACLKYTRVI